MLACESYLFWYNIPSHYFVASFKCSLLLDVRSVTLNIWLACFACCCFFKLYYLSFFSRAYQTETNTDQHISPMLHVYRKIYNNTYVRSVTQLRQNWHTFYSMHIFDQKWYSQEILFNYSIIHHSPSMILSHLDICKITSLILLIFYGMPFYLND